jgi:hypothetical protein
MPSIEITSINYNGIAASITFYSANDPNIGVDLGSQIIPYTRDGNDVYGTYRLNFIDYNKICTVSISPSGTTPTPTPSSSSVTAAPTPTNTITPTATPTATLTPTPTVSITNTPTSSAIAATPTPTVTQTPSASPAAANSGIIIQSSVSSTPRALVGGGVSYNPTFINSDYNLYFNQVF